MKNKKILIVVLAVLVIAFFAFDLGRFVEFDFLKSRLNELQSFYQARPFITIAAYFLLYIVFTGLSLPGAAILTLAAGALFNLFIGTLVVSFASSIGATLAFLASRYLLRDWIELKFGSRLMSFNDNIEKEGATYLFTLRLVPLFPFFLVNLGMGLTKIKTGVFYIVSQIGMLAATIVFVNAGTQIGKLDSLNGILSPSLIFSFTLLGIFPLVAKKALDWFRARKSYGIYSKPK